MKKIVLLTLSFCILSVLSVQANQPQVINNITINNSVNTVVMNTGDVDFDQFLFRLNTAASSRRDVYIGDLHRGYNVPVQRLRHLIHEKNMSPADVLVALQLARMNGAPLKKILNRYRQYRPKGWRAIFRSFDIYPGSRFFIILRQEIPTVIIRYVEYKGSKKRKGSRRKGSKGKGSKRKGSKGKK